MVFQAGCSGNPAGRPKGSVNKQLAMLREAVEKVLPLVVERALAGDAEAQKIILDKGLPKLRAVDSPIEFTLPDGAASTQSLEVIRQAAAGELPLSHAKEIVTALIPILDQQRTAGVSGHSPTGNFMNAYLNSLFQRKGEGYTK